MSRIDGYLHPKVNPVHHRNPVPKHGVWLGQDYRMSSIDGLDAVTQQLAKKIIFSARRCNERAALLLHTVRRIVSRIRCFGCTDSMSLL